MEKSKITYAQAIAEVEQILERFNNEQMNVDELGAQVKRAAELIRLCKERLRKAEKEVDEALKEELVAAFSSELIRFYYGRDLIGNEIGGASKNVIGIAAGMLDGLGLSSLKGALMSRGTREIARLIKALGGNELSAYGLCHLGDYEATVFSPYSHNRQFGESFVRGQDYHQLAEGYYTVKALMLLGQRYGVELPICKAVHDILYEQAVPRDVLAGLLRRGLTEEFYD